MEPSSALATATTFSPASAADAALVPWADAGMSTMSRAPSPLATWNRRMASSPANSPCEPALGCTDTFAYPVMRARRSSRSAMSASQPAAWSSGTIGWMPANSGQVIGSIDTAALSFIVQEPSGIMVRSSARSRSDRRRR